MLSYPAVEFGKPSDFSGIRENDPALFDLDEEPPRLILGDILVNFDRIAQQAVEMKHKGSRIILTAKGGEQLELSVSSKLAFTARLVPARPENKFEGQNEGISFLRLTYTVPTWTDYRFTVNLKPLY